MSLSAVEDEKHIVLVHYTRYGKHKREIYNIIYDLNPNFKELRDDDKYNCLLNSDGPTVKVIARLFYFASLMHTGVNVS